MNDFLRRLRRNFRAFLHSKDALVYLSFVLLATIIWFTNAFSTRRTVTMVIPVTYTHLPDNYIFTVPPTDHVHVTLEDEGVDLFRNRKRLYELVFDLEGYIEHEDEGTFVIPMDELRQAIAQQLVGDAALVAFAPELLTGSYTRQHEKSVSVVYTGHIKPAPQHQLCGDIVLTPEVVTIYGTEKDLAAIDHIETSLTDFEGVQDTFITRLALLAPSNIRVVPDSIRLQVAAEQFTEKAMQIRISAPDMKDNRMLHLFPDQVTVTFRIGTAWFAEVQESDLKVFVDLPQNGIDHLPVHVESNNPHITHIRVKPEEVEYLIEHYETPTDGGSAAAVPAN